MTEWQSRITDILDGHVHMGDIEQEQETLDVAEATGIARMGLVAIQDPSSGSGVPEALYMKWRYPDRFYVFAGLNHATRLSEGKVQTRGLAEQAGDLAAIGCDGMKMIEGKPTSRQRMDVPVTDPYFADYWARVEELGMTIVWHVNDPEEFWDPALTPKWAAERNWGYGPEDVKKETLYAEVDEVLAKHPNLKITFAHFYFLSADLPRAARFLEAHPGTHLDLAPGIEMLYNISRNSAAGREFFLKYADRITFGTDLFSSLSREQAIARAGITFRWLESEDEFRVPEFADFLLGAPEDGVIRGMSLPDDVLTRIYGSNLMRLAGATPKPLKVPAAAAYCDDLARIAAELSGKATEETQAAKVARALTSL